MSAKRLWLALSTTTLMALAVGCRTSRASNSVTIAALVIFSAVWCTTARSGQLSAPLTLTRPWLLFSSRVAPRLIQPHAGWPG